MPQSSGPIVDKNFSDVDWRDAFGDEAGVLGDLDGTAYKITLPTNSDVAAIGSTTQRSTARVGGFVHRIPAGETESITIPAASGSARTDIIALRYDPAFTGEPGPVRLTRIAGTSSGLPTYDAAPPGVEDLPLWSVTRQPGQALSQATVKQLFPRLAPVIELPTTDAPLPLSSPLGTRAKRGSSEYRRTLDTNGVPVWLPAGAPSLVARNWPATTLAGTNNIVNAGGAVVAHLAGAPYRIRAEAALETALGGSGAPYFQLLIDGQVRDQFRIRGVGGTNELFSAKVHRTFDVTDGRSVQVFARLDIPFGVTGTTYTDDRHSFLTVEVIPL